ncbi:hypothetical protein OIY81_3404 [Cryptosporidium canis]|nr:hypothetical protein OIY81_3404 [Cryptosporidium canis]
MSGTSGEYGLEGERVFGGVNVTFEGLKGTNPLLLKSYTDELQGECSLDSIIQKASHVRDELATLDAFSSVSHSVSQSTSNPSEVDVVFKVREERRRYSLGSTINKRGKIGFEASAFFPNLLGTLSTSKFSLETFGGSSRELNVSHFTPKIFSSNINMVYSLSKSLVDHSKSSAFTESSFGSLVKFSDLTGRHNLTVESRIRDLPKSPYGQTEARPQKHDSTILRGQTLKNSICYSWNRIKSCNPEAREDCSSAANEKGGLFAPFKMSHTKTTQQLSLEVAGFSGDVSFLKTQGFYNWSSKLSRARGRPKFLKNINIDFSLGFGAMLPNPFNKVAFRTSVHDKFFLGGNCGAHYCLPGFAPRSVGACTQFKEETQAKESSGLSGSRGSVCLGGDMFVSSEARVSHPIDLSGVGTSIRPNVEAFVSGAVVMDKSDFVGGEGQSLAKRLGRHARAATGFGISVPFGPADLSLLLSTPLKSQSTDMLEGFQLGMRMTYAPL